MSLDNIPISPSQSVKYLGLITDHRLTRSHYIKAKRFVLNIRFRMLTMLIFNNKHKTIHL